MLLTYKQNCFELGQTIAYIKDVSKKITLHKMKIRGYNINTTPTTEAMYL